MRTFVFLLFAAFPISTAFAQATLVKGAPNQLFDLGCAQCSIAVVDLAVWKGIHLLPFNKVTSGMVNLLHWKYYDSIMKAEVTTSSELPWEKCTQLLDALDDTDTISLQINLLWKDSLEQTHPIYLLIGGLKKSELSELPIYSELEVNAEIGLRHFSGIVHARYADDRTETYETLSGEITLTHFEPKSGAIGGHFEFEANCIGWVKRGTFLNGKFEREE
ncbi:MAG: hypothetical protein KF734_22255 [Saprospiraceae bacterium]|nr:hypothetical protein [Saprospiraceae bacterium]